MKRLSRSLLLLFALWLAVPAFAGDKDQLKCGVNQDRVWVYDSLASMDISARLKCGENVEIVSRVKGYVKIHSASGAEGYVPDSSLPDLPPLADPDDKMAAATGAVPSAGSGTSLGAAAKAAVAAASKPSPAINAVSVAANPALVATVAMPTPATPAPIVPPAVAVAPPAAAPVPAAAPAPVTPVVAANSVPKAVPTAAAVVPAAAPIVAAAPVRVSAPAPAPVAAPTPVALVSAPAATPAIDTTAPASAPAKPSNASTKSNKHSKPAPVPPSAAPAPAPSQAPVKQPSVPVSVASVSLPTRADEARLDAPVQARTYPVRDVVMPSHAASVKNAVAEAPIGSEYPDTEPLNESADPACHTFFSAYGLSPSQFKWLAANRQKLYSGICPAPNLASVDFVILFTHDADTYNSAMPTQVHTDRSGFSDFDPLTTVDTALMSGSDADRARQFVWVFRVRRGGFDPMKFSPRRRPQFSTDSKAPARAIQDAFNYVQEQGAQLEAGQPPLQ